MLVAGCGSSSSSNAPRPADQRTLRAYLAAIEPLRRAVNKLLDGAEPILAGYREHRLTAPEAQRALTRLERRYRSYARRVAAVRPVPPVLLGAQRAYAHTYVLELRYLRALIAALPGRRWDKLPNFQPVQRGVIVAWRGALALEAARVQVPLPEDIQIAGLGEIAPAPAANR